MPVDTDAQVVQLMRDYQENGRKVAGLTHAIRKRAETISRFATLINADAAQVMPVAGGGGSTSQKEEWTVVIGNDREVVSFNAVSLQNLHEELTELAKVNAEAKKLESCLRMAGFPDLMERLRAADNQSTMD